MGKEIGIDLGTTNTVVSYMNRYNNIRTMNLKSNKNRAIIPSVIYFKSRNDILIGISAKSKGTLKPRACVKDFKSRLGNMKFKYNVTAENGEKFNITASKAVSIFLKKVIEDAQNVISDEFYDTPELASIDKVVISVPAKFEENQIADLKRAAKEASLNNVELIPEPTAAAIAYINEHDIKNNENILVYDFGGGTFDIAILERNGNSFSSPQTDGDVRLGGNDITKRIIEDVIMHINDDFKMNMPSKPEDYDEEYCNIDKDIFIRNYNEIFRACNDDIKHLYGNNGDEFTGDIRIITGRKDDGNYISRRFDYYYNIDDIENII
ncbi:MAG: Hsp70 family protein, partial [Ruminococcus sp.]|nr:Hsp70 family protein [Ruminococcus sp.]